MPTLGTMTVVGLIAAVLLVWFYLRNRRQDLLTGILEKRRSSAKLVTRAEYVESLEKMPVALALTADSFYYENPELEASFDLNRIDEVEYDDELATGRSIPAGSRALRLRSHGATFEFILTNDDAAKWKNALPPRRLGQPTAQAS
jgi:hypothetical protein